MLQPWVEGGAAADKDESGRQDTPPSTGPIDPLASYWNEVGAALGDLLTVGIQRAGDNTARRWRDLSRSGASIGFARLLQPVTLLAGHLARKQSVLHWDATGAARSALDLASILRLVGGALSASARATNTTSTDARPTGNRPRPLVAVMRLSFGSIE